MLEIKTFTFGPLAENCYVLWDETKECVVVDCGAFTEKEESDIVSFIRGQGLLPRHHVLTHAHPDHCAGAAALSDLFSLLPEAHPAEAPLMENYGAMYLNIFGLPAPRPLPAAGRWLAEGGAVSFGTHELEILPTPGHSPGGVTFLCRKENAALTGDTLFAGSVGRADLPGGSMFLLIQSLRMLCQLDDGVRVLPGHGPETTIGRECAHNPFVDR